MGSYRVNYEDHKHIVNTNHKLNIDNETITEDKVISNHSNKFFSSVARKIVKKYQTQLKPLTHN